MAKLHLGGPLGVLPRVAGVGLWEPDTSDVGCRRRPGVPATPFLPVSHSTSIFFYDHPGPVARRLRVQTGVTGGPSVGEESCTDHPVRTSLHPLQAPEQVELHPQPRLRHLRLGQAVVEPLLVVHEEVKGTPSSPPVTPTTTRGRDVPVVNFGRTGGLETRTDQRESRGSGPESRLHQD